MKLELKPISVDCNRQGPNRRADINNHEHLHLVRVHLLIIRIRILVMGFMNEKMHK